jgi:hypothetical protein
LPGQLSIPEGPSLGVSISVRGDDMMLVLLVNPGSLLERHEGELILESITSRGLVRLRGTVEHVEADLVRFQPFADPELIQRREFVRVIAPQRVTLQDVAGLVVDTHSVNISGGGMLISPPAPAPPIETVLQFSLDLGPRQTPVVGVGKVVRSAQDSQLGIMFTEISDLDRDRLIRFIFDRQRRALALTRGDSL